MKEILLNKRWPLILPEHREKQWKGGWEVERLSSMYSNIRSTDIVFEGGSEEGDMSALFAQWSAGIVMAEPGPRVWTNIREIFEANNLVDKVVATWAGFFSDTTTINLPVAARTFTWPGCAYGEIIENHGFRNLDECPQIPRITIDDMAVRIGVRPDIISFDVEGAEYKVLLGAKKTLARSRPLVYASIHPDFMQAYGDTEKDIVHLMKELDYNKIHLATDHEIHNLYIPCEFDYEDGIVQRQ